MYVYVAIAILSAALSGFGSWQIQSWRHDAEKAAQLAEANRINAKRSSVSIELGQKSNAAQVRVRTVTKTIVQEVPTYVSSSDLPLSPSFRVFHDAAAAGQLPDAGRIADAAAVRVDSLAETLAWNYGACLENAERLRGLQEWVRAQGAVK